MRGDRTSWVRQLVTSAKSFQQTGVRIKGIGLVSAFLCKLSGPTALAPDINSCSLLRLGKGNTVSPPSRKEAKPSLPSYRPDWPVSHGLRGCPAARSLSFPAKPHARSCARFADRLHQPRIQSNKLISAPAKSHQRTDSAERVRRPLCPGPQADSPRGSRAPSGWHSRKPAGASDTEHLCPPLGVSVQLRKTLESDVRWHDRQCQQILTYTGEI